MRRMDRALSRDGVLRTLARGRALLIRKMSALLADVRHVHHPGGSAPSASYYGRRERHATQIAAVTAAVSCRHGRRRPTTVPSSASTAERVGDSAAAAIRRKARPKANSGAPSAPRVDGGWQLGAPDLVVTCRSPTRSPPTHRRVPPSSHPVPTDRARLRSRPDSGRDARVVHHANIRVDGRPHRAD